MAKNVIILDDNHYIKNNKIVKKVEGYGINDADYVLKPYLPDGTRYYCPLYQRWYNMLSRCYSPLALIKKPQYKGVTVCEEWLTFSNFKSWMEQQDWEGNHLDKDLLVYKNKVYSPETCVFVTPTINSFLTKADKARGEYPIGVCFDSKRGRFRASCKNPFTKKLVSVGYRYNPIEAHVLWQKYKIKMAGMLKQEENNNVVITGLQRVIDKIQFDIDNSLITEDF